MNEKPNRNRAAIAVGIIWVVIGGIIGLCVAAACALTALAGHVSSPGLHATCVFVGVLIVPIFLPASGIVVAAQMHRGEEAASLAVLLFVTNVALAVGAVAGTYAAL